MLSPIIGVQLPQRTAWLRLSASASLTRYIEDAVVSRCTRPNTDKQQNSKKRLHGILDDDAVHGADGFSLPSQQEPKATSGHKSRLIHTSSARASSVGGTSRPTVLAVVRLITSSYLTGACTGRLALNGQENIWQFT